MPDQVSPSQNHHSMRVLVVDDVPEVRRELSILLELTGEVQVVGEATNGVEAISQVNALHPDVVVMDMEMPILDGFAATSQIKANYPDCRVIALTIHDGEAVRQRAARAGVDAFMVKGTPVQTLLQAICLAAAEE